MGKPKTAEERAELSAKAFELRKAGVSYGKIARQLNVSAATVHKYIQAQIQAYQEEAREAHKSIVTMELSRLDDMVLGVWSKARAGEYKAIDAMIKIMERRSKLLGLDTVQTTRQLNLTVTPDQIAEMSDEELTTLITQLNG
jgi:predicted transcriptional regulator